MNMNYRVTFIKKADPSKDQKDENLGWVFVDDTGTSESFTLASKAFRHCPHNMLVADKLIFEQV